MPVDSVSDLEIEAYVDDQLDLQHRIVVEHYLARHPLAAMRVMEDFAARSSLRAHAAAATPPSSELTRAGARLGRRLARPAHLRRLSSAVGIAGCGAAAMALAFVTTAHRAVDPPAYLSDALMARRTSLIRAAMPSQPESQNFDRREIQRNTSLRVPVLPEGWRITDVQIFPSDNGPALQLMVRAPDRTTISIFAVRAREDAPYEPTVLRRGAESIAYWRKADIAYAVTGAETPDLLGIAARDLADNRLN